MKLPILAILFLPLAAHGSVVTTLIDEDDGMLGLGAGVSLREAVSYSAANEIITFAPALSGQTIRLTGGYLAVNQSLTIDASGLPAGLILSADRTGNGKTADDTYAILLTAGNLFLDSLTLTGANCGESAGCITLRASSAVSLTLDHCVLAGNAGYHASALYFVGSPTRPNDAITLRNSTVTRNSVVKGPSVVSVSSCNLSIQNSTFSQNKAGAIAYGTNNPLVTLSLSSSTISGNASNYGSGGLYIDYTSSPFTIYINNTICAGNQLANIYNPSPNATISGSNNILAGNPLLAPLGDYGGPTQTMLPLPGSPAIDAGATTLLAADQRGFPRVSTPDIGAVESQGSADLARLWNLDWDGDGSPYGVEQALGSDPAVADSANTRNLTPPAISASGDAILRFGLSASAQGIWILARSPDLSPGSFTEIYRTDRVADTAAPGVTFVRTPAGVTVTDGNPPPGGGFYRIEARSGP